MDVWRDPKAPYTLEELENLKDDAGESRSIQPLIKIASTALNSKTFSGSSSMLDLNIIHYESNSSRLRLTFR